MKNSIRWGSAFALAGYMAMSVPAIANVPTVVTVEARTPAGGRSIEVLVPQGEIKSDINQSNLAVATGGGLLGGLLAASQNASRAKKAEAAITPVREALAGFDADALALDTTKAAVAKVGWLQPTEITASKDSSALGKSGYLDSKPAIQAFFVEYSYDLSPDFNSVRVVAKLSFANKALPPSQTKPESRINPRYLAYATSITSIVVLPAPGKDITASAALWATDHAAPARAALKAGFAAIETLLPRALALTEADVKAMNGRDHQRGGSAGFSGRMVDKDNSLLWSDGFITTQVLSTPAPAAS